MSYLQWIFLVVVFLAFAACALATGHPMIALLALVAAIMCVPGGDS